MALKSRKALFAALGILVAGYLLYHFRASLHLSQFSGAKLWEAVRRANFVYLVLSIVGIYGCYALRALRWQKFQSHLGPSKFWNIYRMTLAGFSALFLLGRVAEPVRPLLISRKDKIPLSDIFGIYTLERILDAASTAVLAAAGLLIFESSGHLDAQGTGQAFEKGARTAGTFFALFAIVAISGLIYLRLHGSGFLERRMQGWLAQHGWRAGVARNLLGFVRGVQTIRSWGDVAAAVVYSALHWLLVVCVYLLVLQSFGGKLAAIKFSDAVLILVFSLVGSAVQLPGVGGGSQALGIVALTKLYGVEQEPAVAAAMILWLVTFASCSFAGVPILVREGWSLGELKRMREHEGEQIEAELAGQSTSKTL
jgi:glycosyltransferase 2 family protein